MTKLIGLIDMDQDKGTNLYGIPFFYPNLALMKISAYYKKKGYKVEWYKPIKRYYYNYHKIFVSKVFTKESTWTPYLTKNMIIGGSGYDLHIKLPDKIEHIYPDYDLYGIDYAMGFLCYDDKTEVLTKDDWKLFKNLSYNDELLTLHPETHYIEYQKPKEIIINEYDGELIKFVNKYVDLCVTPNHRLYIKNRKSKKENEKFDFQRAEDVENLYQFRFKKDGKWKGIEKEFFHLPNIENYNNNCNLIDKIKMDDWLNFLGIFIAEGNTQYKKKTRSYIIKISQSKKSKYYHEIEDFIKKLNLNYYISPYGDFFISNKQLYSFLKPLGKSYEKYIPKEFLQLSPRQLKILWNAIYLGDGTHYSNSNTEGISTSSKKLAGNLQELLLKIGYSGDIRLLRKKGTMTYFKRENREIIARHNHYGIFRNTYYTNPTHFRKLSGTTKRIKYKDKIYCAEVSNHLLFVRRNGKAVWCGNTRGCIRNCDFCIVPEKEGYIHKNADLEEFWDGQEKVRFLDNNFLAYKNHKEELKKFIKTDKRFDFNQGLDIRLVNNKNAPLLKEMRLWKGKRYVFAFDDIKLKSIIERKLKILNDNGIKNSELTFFVLVGFNSTMEEDLVRIYFLRDKGIRVYVMPYDKTVQYQKDLMHWGNYKPFYFKMDFETFLKREKRKEINKKETMLNRYLKGGN